MLSSNDAIQYMREVSRDLKQVLDGKLPNDVKFAAVVVYTTDSGEEVISCMCNGSGGNVYMQEILEGGLELLSLSDDSSGRFSMEKAPVH